MKIMVSQAWKRLSGLIVFCLLLCSSEGMASMQQALPPLPVETAYVTADTDEAIDLNFPDHDKVLHVTQRYAATATDQTSTDKSKKLFHHSIKLIGLQAFETHLSHRQYEGILCSFSFRKLHILYCIYRI